MRILFFSSNSAYTGKAVGGAEHSLRFLAEKFAEGEHEVLYLTRPHKKRFSLGRSVDVNRVTVVFLPVIRIPTFGLAVLKRLNHRLDYLLLCFSFLVNRRYRACDVIHTYNEYPDTFQILTISRLTRARFKVIVRVAGLFWFEISKENDFLKRRVTEVFNSVDGCNFISSGLKSMFDEIVRKHNYGINLRCSFITDIGANVAVSDRKWNLNDSFEISMVARFVNRAKRYDLLIKAFEDLGNDNLKLNLIGEGPEKTRWMRYCHQSEFLRDRVVFHGYLNHQQLFSVLLRSNLFCLCSDYEGLSKAVIEALSIGLPVCVSDVVPLNTYIVEGENGFLCANEVEAWKSKLSYLVQNRHLLVDVAERGLRFASENFNPDKNILQYNYWFNKVACEDCDN